MTDLVKVIYKGNEMVSGLKGKDGIDGKNLIFKTQEEYNALPQSEKMNGMTYAIYRQDGDMGAAMQSFSKFLLGGGTIEEIDSVQTSGGVSYNMPDGCYIVYIVLNRFGSQIGGGTSLLFTRGLPTTQIVGLPRGASSSGAISFTCSADFDNGTFTIAPTVSGTSSSYTTLMNVKIAFF